MEVTTFLAGHRGSNFPVTSPQSSDRRCTLNRSTSPHPSVSSSGSEEVRCSLDELDAVIATYDDGSGRQNAQDNTSKAAICCPVNHVSSSFGKRITDSRQNETRRSSCTFLENERLLGAVDSTDYSTATLRNPRRQSDREPSVELHASRTTGSFHTVEPEFPPPPPVETFAPDSFILPPPPSAISDPKALRTFQPGGVTGPIYVRTSLPLQVISKCSLTTACPNPAQTRARSSSMSPPQPPKMPTRPTVPQRAPSTRLSTVPTSPDAPTPKSPSSRHSRTHDVVQSCSSSQQSHSAAESSLDQQPVPPVNEMIRRFDVLTTADSGQPTVGLRDKAPAQPPTQSKPRTETTNPSHSSQVVPSADSQAPVNRSTSPNHTKTQLFNDGPDTSPLPTVQQLAREFSAAMAASNAVANNTQGTGLLPSRYMMNGSSTQGQNLRSMVHPLAPPLVVKDPHNQTSGGIGVSFGRCSPTHRLSDPRRQQTQKSSRSADLAESQLSSFSSSGARLLSTSQTVEQAFRPIQCLRLDPTTLDTLLRYNIVDANQIPGYQSICVGNLPDWKLQKLERKNREAADAYAMELQKWGQIPPWKREIIEKRQFGKSDTGLGSPCCDIRPEQHASLISAELTAKLQRRLEKVDSVPTS
ncbi:hypothetical protein CSKR_200016 [Clonorchis sinensis]|uniref:Uncharacterized protein n=1 Tax=Clonorchis sinensis TaxID=79923 RepID=A0A8T1LY79_CLOSI|nr:hypothetical protein CSKR_200016 [Clonorchis sinensis]